MTVDTVFFDLDGTLLEHDEAYSAAFRRALLAIGLERSEAELSAAIAAAWPWYEAHAGRHEGDEMSFWGRFNERVCLEAGFGARAAEAGRAITDEFRGLDDPGLYDDVLPCLDTLGAAGYRLGVITARPDAARVLAPTGIAGRFRWLVDAFGSGSAKGDEGAFLYALKLAAIRSERAVHVGDLYEKDVIPARAAGMTAVLLDREDAHRDADCPRIKRLDELPALLDGRNRPR